MILDANKNSIVISFKREEEKVKFLFSKNRKKIYYLIYCFQLFLIILILPYPRPKREVPICLLYALLGWSNMEMVNAYHFWFVSFEYSKDTNSVPKRKKKKTILNLVAVKSEYPCILVYL